MIGAHLPIVLLVEGIIVMSLKSDLDGNFFEVEYDENLPIEEKGE